MLKDGNKREIKKNEWVFDWHLELKEPERDVYKLVTVNNPKIIHGLISIEDGKDHIYMHLLENAKFNKGKSKVYLGVAGNLVAFACKVSFEKKYEGFLAFNSKTALMKHYQDTLGAIPFGGTKMFIETKQAQILVDKYFNSK